LEGSEENHLESWTGGVAQVVENMSRNCKDSQVQSLSSNSVLQKISKLMNNKSLKIHAILRQIYQ
jgi:hypothetical protein